MKLQKATKAPGGLKPPEIPRVPMSAAPIPLPSSRQRVLQTLFDEAGGGGGGFVPEDFGLRQMADGTFSLPTDIVAGYDVPLANAYAQGITLRPSGCEYAPGAEYEGTPPMTYMAYRTTYASPEVFGKQVPVITRATEYTWFLQIQWRTPWPVNTRRTYVLELSMDDFDSDFDITLYSAGSGNVPGQSLEPEFSPTTDGSQMALVEIPGSGGSTYTHILWFRPHNYENMSSTFNWLNIIAV